MKPGIADHLIVFTLVVVLPIAAVPGYRRLVAAVKTDPNARRSGYQGTILLQWSLVAVVLTAWLVAGREIAAIGLRLPLGIESIIGFALTAAALAGLHLQTLSFRRGGDKAREELRAQISSVQELMPRTQQEAQWFRGMAITAGICEEVLYRGFLIAYLGALLGTWPAVVAGAALFGVAHLYQGPANALKGVVAALVAGALYVGCGTLLWPMILHAALDLNGGALGRLALTGSNADDPDATPTAAGA